MTLGKLIKELEMRPPEQRISYDFCDFKVNGIHSWRGVYAELAIGFNEHEGCETVADVIGMLRGAIGKTYTGWKGGEFTMQLGTPIHIDDPGCYTNTEIRYISGDEFSTIINTSRD